MEMKTAIVSNDLLSPRSVRPVFSTAAVWTLLLGTIVAHGCHTGGHDIDVEPMIMNPHRESSCEVR
jgi:hypothetical protein